MGIMSANEFIQYLFPTPAKTIASTWGDTFNKKKGLQTKTNIPHQSAPVPPPPSKKKPTPAPYASH